MCSLKSPCTTSYMSSIDTTALTKLLSFWENGVFLHFGDRQTDRQTNRQTDKRTSRWTDPMHWAALAIASGGLIISAFAIATGNCCMKNGRLKLCYFEFSRLNLHTGTLPEQATHHLGWWFCLRDSTIDWQRDHDTCSYIHSFIQSTQSRSQSTIV